MFTHVMARIASVSTAPVAVSNSGARSLQLKLKLFPQNAKLLQQ